jgi:hypothetical protein
MGNLYTFLRLSSRIFRHSDDFTNFREHLIVVGCPYCAVSVPVLMLVLLLASLYYFWHPFCGGLPSAVDTVMFLLSLMLLASLHAIACFSVFATIPAFDGVHTVLAVLLLLSFPLLLAFLLL